MRSRWRRIRANFRFLRKPTLEFLPILAGMTALVIWGGYAFWRLYPEEVHSFAEGLYLTYCLIFMEHLVDFPDHWLLRVFFVVLPPLGLAVILDGIVRFSYHILRRDETSAEWVHAMSHTMKNHVVLFGLGKLGLRVLQELVKLKELVVVVERDDHSPNIAYARQHGVPVRIATGREAGLLDELNVQKAKSLIMATDDDLINLEVAIDARKLKPELRVVMRMFDQELAAKVKESFGLHLAFSTSELAAPLFASASSDATILNSFYVGEQLMIVSRLNVSADGDLAGRSVADLRREYQTVVLDIKREEGSRFFPEVDEVVRAGDRLTVQCGPERLRRVQEANGMSPDER